MVVNQPSHRLSFSNFSGKGNSSFEPLMGSVLVVIKLEGFQFSFQVVRIPERHMVKILAPDRPDQAFHEWM